MTPMTLRLRCREPEFSRAPADVAAFLTGARSGDAETGDPLLWLLSSVPSPQAMGLSASSCCAGIPTPEHYLEVILSAPDTRSWNFSPYSRTTRTMAALALAGGLAFAPAPAFAADDEPAEEAAEVDEGDDATEAAEGAPPAAEEAAPAPLSYEGDELWAAVRGARVEITIREGGVLRGILLTQAADEIAIAREPDGSVARVPKHMVSRLRVIRMPNAAGSAGVWDQNQRESVEIDERPQSGEGAAIAGGVLTITAGSMMLTSLFVTAVTGSLYYGGPPMMIIGSSLLGPGIPLLAWGSAQMEKRRRWDRDHDLEVSLAPTVGGFSGSLRFRF